MSSFNLRQASFFGKPADNPLADPSPENTETLLHYKANGLRAWSIVLAAFLAHFVALGTVYATGIFLVPIVEEFNATRADVAFVGTANAAVFYGGGFLAG